MTERRSGNHDLLQVQYVFLELPKLPPARPAAPGADLWAWLFAHAPELHEIPADLATSPATGPYRAALELANKAKFTRTELDAYRRVTDEIQQAEELAEAKWAQGKAEGRAEGRAEGKAEGLAEGKAQGKAEGLAEGEAVGRAKALLAVLTARGLSISADTRTRIESCQDPATFDRWLSRALQVASADQIFTAPP